MTPKELYDWAAENGAEDYDLKIEWIREYEFGHDVIKEEQVSICESFEEIIINI